jgi:arylsulfatase A-like enzyme
MTNMVTQVPMRRAAGTWRVVALERRSTLRAENVFGIQLEREGLFQQSDSSRIVLHSGIRQGEALLLTVTYDRRWVPTSADQQGLGSLEVQIRDAAGVVAAVRRPIQGWASEVTIELPAEEGTTVELCFDLAPGQELPLNSIAGVAIPLDATPREANRARTYLSWAARDHDSHAQVGLRKARVPISLAGCTRDALTMVDGDTLTFDMPRQPRGSNLMFWIGGLRMLSHVTSRLEVDGEMGSEWTRLGRIDGAVIRPFTWSDQITVPVPEDCREIRFVYAGDDEVVALGMPHLKALSKRSHTKSNVILIDLDTMRADRLNCYGYAERATSRTLDEVLNEKGFFVFRNAYSPASWTLPATAKFLCSRYRGFGLGSAVDPSHMTLAELLRDSGYYCIGFTGGGYLRISGFEQGFHEYFWTEEYGKVEQTFTPAMAWLRKQHTEPFFLFIHTYEPHTPFTRDTFCRELPRGRLGDISKGEALFPHEFSITAEVSAEESLFIQAAYDGGVKKACDATAELFAVMDSLELWRNTVVAILSDHGEEFWDHSASFAAHRYTSLYGELLNVPFMIYAPEKRGGGMKIIETQVTTVDLMPTIAELVKSDMRDTCDGISLCSLMSGGVAKRAVPILALNWPDERLNEHDRRTCVLAGGRKYIEQLGADAEPRTLVRQGGYPSDAIELFDLARDPSEQSNVANVDPALAVEMGAILRHGLETAAVPKSSASADETAVGLSRKLRKQLEALGYLDGG